MVQADYSGARGSNAGDDFHELWALRQALALLDHDTKLTAVAVEGLKAEDESGTPKDTWDGVDCTLYFGSDHAASAERIVIAQLKYSGANPNQSWTVARVTQTSNKKKDNSVVGRLAKAFAGLQRKRPDLVASRNLLVQFVSNQRVDLSVIKALSGENAEGRAALVGTSGLKGQDFERFAAGLDFAGCGHDSRFGLEERVLATISGWTDNDARTSLDHLMRYVRRTMMPESKDQVITRNSILLQFGFSDRRALFPCPSTLTRIDRPIERTAARILVEQMKKGEQRICLHGEGGCGKTTALQELNSLLPEDSVVIVFDCYGNGRYLNSDAYRHRPPDAFLQLSNELATDLRMPFLLTPSRSHDYPRVFKKRLVRAAEITASRRPEALLVVIVDAADNSVTAAKTQSPPERSFLQDFVTLSDLPENVRFVVTARTGTLKSLSLPYFTQVVIKGFDLNETAGYVRRFWNDAPDNWIADFHHLSDGNPRVQQYALDYARTEPARAVDYLRPSGKNLDEIFRAQLLHAKQKQGYDEDIKMFCAGLVALSRPIPVATLSAVTGLNESHITDICRDLAPGVRLNNNLISFADEDFEHFVRTEAGTHLIPIQMQIADHFISHYKYDAYAATHVAAALLAAKRGREIISLINEEREPTVIGDPVLRRETQLERLRIAMKVCREREITSMLY